MPTIGSKVEIEVGATDAGGSVKSIKTQLREAKEEAIQLAVKFGENSTQATAAASNVAKLKDRVEDLGLKIKGLNPDKFQRIATLTAGIGQGFVAAQGAMALFGSESKDLEKTMIKLQGAIALSQGLQGIKDLSLLFSGLGKTIMTQVVTAFSTLRGALLSTGIGALVVALGFIVSKLMAARDATNLMAKSHEEFQKILQATSDILDKVANRAEDASLRMKVALGEITTFEAEKLKLKRGYDAEQTKVEQDFNDKIAELNKNYNENYIKTKKSTVESDKIHYDEVEELKRQSVLAQFSLDKEYNSNVEALDFEAKKKKEAELKTQSAEAIQKAKEKKDAALQAIIDQAVREQNARVLIEANQKKDDEGQLKYKQDLEQKKEDLIFAELDAEEKKYEALAAARKKDKADEENLLKLRYSLVSDGLQAINDLTILFQGKSEAQAKRAFDIQKGLSIVQTIISTIEAAQAGYKAGMLNPLLFAIPGANQALAVFNATVATAAGLARVKQIKATTFNSTNIPTGASGGNSFSPPSVNPSIQQQRQITGNTTGVTGNQTRTNDIKVYVTETDISERQGRVNEIRRVAVVH